MSGITTTAVRVLLVSPEPRTIALLSDILQQFGIEVETCNRQEMASHRLGNSKYDGLIVDLLLGNDALKLLRSLSDQALNSGLIACAVLRDDDQKISAFQAGANFVFESTLDRHVAWRTICAAYPLMSGDRR
jgi:DNA-binding response OmpR family regulator